MWAYRITVDAEERDGYKRPVAPEAQDSIAQLKSNVMFFGIVLMKIDVYTPQVERRRTLALEAIATTQVLG